ncbi:DODA-type extradiol aromatic ring-opening family dioxygenase [Paenibacillus protaetiae]|uniref:Dioxygenase n=1 Tax=Paenibacillus protaetiae TaxID=2509456 RepID=A0A4P6F887_9BACL|nr:class III extradiol ring-cleavage dioxygenase [Paenibacillus protaetiae]QAY66658.1 dioxygenase [Paenibacillus protaetiae]
MSPLFLAHGSPMLAIEENDYSRFLQQTGASLKPDAIVIFTAHWETDDVTITHTDGVYETIYDFYGFPDELFQVKYPARGSKSYAEKVGSLLKEQGIPYQFDENRGLDHGSWTLLKHLFPQADIPVVQVSVNPYRSAKDHYEIGKALRSLSDLNVLVIGSGVTVHNLRAVNWNASEAEPWAVQFDDWLIEKLQQGDLESLFAYDSLAPNAQRAVPRAEHFVPLYVALGSGQKPEVIFRGYQFGSLSYLCLRF